MILRPPADAKPFLYSRGVPSALRFAVREDGQIERTSPWFPFVEFPTDILATADGKNLVMASPDELEIRCVNGGAVYALAPEESGARRGRLVRHW